MFGDPVIASLLCIILIPFVVMGLIFYIADCMAGPARARNRMADKE